MAAAATLLLTAPPPPPPPPCPPPPPSLFVAATIRAGRGYVASHVQGASSGAGCNTSCAMIFGLIFLTFGVISAAAITVCVVTMKRRRWKRDGSPSESPRTATPAHCVTGIAVEGSLPSTPGLLPTCLLSPPHPPDGSARDSDEMNYRSAEQFD